MKFILEIDKLDNDAFDGGNMEAEIYRILREAAVKVRDGWDTSSLYDVNGNTVGSFKLE